MLEARAPTVNLTGVQSVRELIQAVEVVAVQTHQPRLEQGVVEAVVFMVQRHSPNSITALAVAEVVGRTTMWVTVPQERLVATPVGSSMSLPMRLRFREALPAMAGMAVTP